jgi:hypothetical protein
MLPSQTHNPSAARNQLAWPIDVIDSPRSWAHDDDVTGYYGMGSLVGELE